jgi:RodZ C-terminal domain
MWLLVLLLAVSILVTALVRRRGRDTRDSVDDQRQRLDALRVATTGTNAPPGEMGGVTAGGTTRARNRSPMTGRAVLVALAVVVAGVAIYAIAAGWDTNNPRGESKRTGSDQTRSSTATTASTSTTTTTAPPAVAIVGTNGGTVNISVPAGPYKVTIAARSSCWLLVERPDGTTVETTTLQADDSRDYEESGPLTVRLGNPGGVDVAINGQPLSLPASNGNAMNLEIAPAA